MIKAAIIFVQNDMQYPEEIGRSAVRRDSYPVLRVAKLLVFNIGLRRPFRRRIMLPLDYQVPPFGALFFGEYSSKNQLLKSTRN